MILDVWAITEAGDGLPGITEASDGLPGITEAGDGLPGIIATLSELPEKPTEESISLSLKKLYRCKRMGSIYCCLS